MGKHNFKFYEKYSFISKDECIVDISKDSIKEVLTEELNYDIVVLKSGRNFRYNNVMRIYEEYIMFDFIEELRSL